MKKYLAVLDTNVIISAMLNPKSVPGKIVAEALNGCIIPIISNRILFEYTDVIHRPKFKFNSEAVNVFLEDLQLRAICSQEAVINDIFTDTSDVIFYAVLMEVRKFDDAYLITGNLKHFPDRPYIISPRAMLELLIDNP